jgi:hypothetical protein
MAGMKTQEVLPIEHRPVERLSAIVPDEDLFNDLRRLTSECNDPPKTPLSIVTEQQGSSFVIVIDKLTNASEIVLDRDRQAHGHLLVALDRDRIAYRGRGRDERRRPQAVRPSLRIKRRASPR